jgi:hypothetical protein
LTGAGAASFFLVSSDDEQPMSARQAAPIARVAIFRIDHSVWHDVAQALSPNVPQVFRKMAGQTQ